MDGSSLSFQHKIPTHKLGEELNHNRVVAATRRHGKRAGILVRDHRMIDQWQESGFSCLAVDSDIAILREGWRRVSSLRERI